MPAIIPLWMILQFGTNVPVWDQWNPDMAGIFLKAHQHQLTFTDFVAQHNEHRILIPRLIYYVIDSFSHWNTVVEMTVGWGIVLLTSLEILWLLQLTLGPLGGAEPIFSSQTRLLLWALCNILIFSASQAHNWLWGIGLANFTPAFFTLAALVAAIHPRLTRGPRVVAVAVLCSAATWSSGNGLVSWPLAIVVLAWSESLPELKSKLPAFSGLFIVLAVNLALYFFHFQVPPHGVRDPYEAGPLRVAEFFTVFIGNLGLIHPHMIRDRNANGIVSGAAFAKGEFVRVTRSDSDEITCVGWAVLPEAGKAASAVFITADDEKGEPIIIGFGGMGASWTGVIPSFQEPDLAGAGWAANIPLPRLATSVWPIQLRAWALDPETGRACRLEGSFQVSR